MAATHPPVHSFTLFRGATNISLHPLQRAGLVPAQSAYGLPAVGVRDTSSRLGDSVHMAGYSNLIWPPVVPDHGGPRDPRVMVG